MAKHLDLVDRLRGLYRIPVNDGGGPLNDSDTFTREFDVPPIQFEAADEIERLRKRVAELEARSLDVEALGRAMEWWAHSGSFYRSGRIWDKGECELVAARYAEELARREAQKENRCEPES